MLSTNCPSWNAASAVIDHSEKHNGNKLFSKLTKCQKSPKCYGNHPNGPKSSEDIKSGDNMIKHFNLSPNQIVIQI
ncbi:hypothetical protein QQG55_7340 [Brugia pahangi]